MKHNQRDDAKNEELHRYKIFGRDLPSIKLKFLICNLLIRVVDEISAGVNFPCLSLLQVLLKAFSVHLILDTNVCKTIVNSIFSATCAIVTKLVITPLSYQFRLYPADNDKPFDFQHRLVPISGVSQKGPLIL